MAVSFIGATSGSDTGTALTLALSAANDSGTPAAGDLAIAAVAVGQANTLDPPAGWKYVAYSPSNPPKTPANEAAVFVKELTDVDISTDNVTFSRDAAPADELIVTLSVWRSSVRDYEDGATYFGRVDWRGTSASEAVHRIDGFAFSADGVSLSVFVDHDGANITVTPDDHVLAENLRVGTNRSRQDYEVVSAGATCGNARYVTISNAVVSQWLIELNDPSEVIDDRAAPYGVAMARLLPPGRWNLSPSSVLSKLFAGAGRELARVAMRAADLIDESDPRLASELIEDYELELELDGTGTTAERLAVIESKLVTQQRVRPADFREALAPLFGQDASAVVIVERDRAFAVAVSDDSAIFLFFAYRDPAAGGSYDLAAAQAQIDAMAPSHTQGFAVESIDMECDDPFSLCDRDLLGV